MHQAATTLLILAGGMIGLAMGIQPMRPESNSTRPLAQALSKEADLIVLDGNIWTGERDPSGRTRTVQAVAIAGGRFIAVGSNQNILALKTKDTKIIRLEGRRVVPGLIDSHVHFIAGGFQLLSLDLKHVKSEDEFVRLIGERAKTLPPGRWLRGGNWDEEAWPLPALPTRWQIDGVTATLPVLLRRYDGHAALANSLALKLAGLSRETSTPPDGVIVRDPATGEPTGVLKDAAIGLVAKAIPRPSDAEMEESLRAALGEAGRAGVTSVHNITLDEQTPSGSFWGEVELLRRAEREKWLTVRQYLLIPIDHVDELAAAGKSQRAESEWLRLLAVKGFADGSLGSRTAWMFDPFDDTPGSRGLPMALMDPPSKMEDLVRKAQNAGIHPCVHAIGDRAVSEMLELFERVGGKDSRAARFRIEHAQHMRSMDFARFGKLGVIASMQPYHAIDDGRWAEKTIGARRARTCYAWRSMLEAGAPLAFGSDWPVAPLSPILGIHAAVTRATLDGKHPDGWIPEERLTVEEAMSAYTAGSAFAAFEEEEKGTISLGKLADLVVLSEDILAVPPERIKDVSPKMTVVGGKIVYEKD
ncbi:MAG: amidohydrolase [Acidobacteria bacterium]|nr:amidohydrolase [Acidobacteriota bacterium]